MENIISKPGWFVNFCYENQFVRAISPNLILRRRVAWDDLLLEKQGGIDRAKKSIQSIISFLEEEKNSSLLKNAQEVIEQRVKRDAGRNETKKLREEFSEEIMTAKHLSEFDEALDNAKKQNPLGYALADVSVIHEKGYFYERRKREEAMAGLESKMLTLQIALGEYKIVFSYFAILIGNILPAACTNQVFLQLAENYFRDIRLLTQTLKKFPKSETHYDLMGLVDSTDVLYNHLVKIGFNGYLVSINQLKDLTESH